MTHIMKKKTWQLALSPRCRSYFEEVLSPWTFSQVNRNKFFSSEAFAWEYLNTFLILKKSIHGSYLKPDSTHPGCPREESICTSIGRSSVQLVSFDILLTIRHTSFGAHRCAPWLAEWWSSSCRQLKMLVSREARDRDTHARGSLPGKRTKRVAEHGMAHGSSCRMLSLTHCTRTAFSQYKPRRIYILSHDAIEARPLPLPASLASTVTVKLRR